MSETEQTKVCPLCAETIKGAAKVCPHCRKIQKRGLFITKYDLFALAACVLFFAAVILLWNFFAEGRHYLPKRNGLEVLNTQIGLDQNREYTNVFLSGIMTNTTEYSWSVGQFEVRFLNGEKVTDAEHGGDNFIVLPHTDHSFRLTLYSRKAIPKFDSYQVKVAAATDPRSWFFGD